MYLLAVAGISCRILHVMFDIIVEQNVQEIRTVTVYPVKPVTTSRMGTV